MLEECSPDALHEGINLNHGRFMNVKIPQSCVFANQTLDHIKNFLVGIMPGEFLVLLQQFTERCSEDWEWGHFWSCVGDSGGGMLYTALTLVGVMICSFLFVDTSNEGHWQLCDGKFLTIEDKTKCSGHLHELMEPCDMFFIILPMQSDIIWNPNHAITELWICFHCKISWAQARPQGRYIKQYCSHGMLEVVSSDDS